MTARDLNRFADITTILSLYGIHPNRAGFIRCIVHNENTPSMKVYPKTNSAHCFGCGANLDSIGVVMALDGCDFKHACDKIRTIFNLSDEPFARAEVARLKRENERKARVEEKHHRRFIALCDALHDLETQYYALVPFPVTDEFLNDDFLTTAAAEIGFNIWKLNREIDHIADLLYKVEKFGVERKTTLTKVKNK